jgi:mono/diheme cytochrome c family protein
MAICMLRWGWFLLAAAAAIGQPADPNDFFESRIRPIFARSCFACHTQSALGGLRIDSLEALLKGGNSGPAIVPGHPDKSLLVLSVSGRHERFKMPMSGAALTEAEVGALRHWIELGAPWPAAKQRGAAQEIPSNHWAFQPVRKAIPPTVRNQAWARSPIDRFILAKLEERGLAAVPSAGKRELIRRATFDLTGLPPTPEEIDAFLADKTPDAFRRVVDRLLESPHYGERWGRHWLDVVRYADAEMQNQGEHRFDNAWRYRDWVIEAFTTVQVSRSADSTVLKTRH